MLGESGGASCSVLVEVPGDVGGVCVLVFDVGAEEGGGRGVSSGKEENADSCTNTNRQNIRWC